MAEMATTRPTTAMNETEFQQYRPLFGPAVVAFVLGLLSLFALIPWSLMLILPLAAVFSGLWALVKLRRLGSVQTGRRWMVPVIFGSLGAVVLSMMAVGDAVSHLIVPAMRAVRSPVSVIATTFMSGQFVLLGLMGLGVVLAVVGLAKLPKITSDAVSGDRLVRLGLTLGLVCAAGGTVNTQVPRQMLIRSAAQTGHDWLAAMAQERYARAILLMLHPVLRPPDTVALDRLLEDRDMRDAFNNLKEVPLFQTMSALGPETKIHLDGVEDVIYRGNGTEVQIAYRVIDPSKEGRTRYFLVALQLVVDRNRRTGEQQWRVYDHQAPYSRGTYQIPRRAEPVHEHDH